MHLTETDHREISELVHEFAWRIDHDEGHAVEELFTEDGVYDLGGWEHTGRVAIRALYDDRRAQGERTSRHLFANLRLRPSGDGTVTGNCTLTLHAHNGPPPHPLSPVMVSDYIDSYQRCNGQWLFRSRTVEFLFLQSTNEPDELSTSEA